MKMLYKVVYPDCGCFFVDSLESADKIIRKSYWTAIYSDGNRLSKKPKECELFRSGRILVWFSVREWGVNGEKGAVAIITH